ncbi:MAG: protein phosphatase 2C domain-containing protein [Pseudomonadota bacterium]
MTSSPLVVTSTGITDVGQKRDHNEDSFFSNDTLHLYVVSDGMGGHKAGEVASRIVVETIQDRMQQSSDTVEGAHLIETEKPLSAETTRLLAAIHLANQAVYHIGSSKEDYKGMGATVSAVLLADTRIIVANVGDSPVYLIRNADIELLSELHTYMAEHAALAPPGAKPLSEKYRHMITRAMGVKPSVVPSFCEIQGLQDDIIILCSDGLSDKLSPKEILAVVNKYGVDKACKALVMIANKRGGDDNITVIVLHITQHPNSIPERSSAASGAPPTGAPSAEPSEGGGIPVDIDTDDASRSATLFSLSSDGGFIPTTEAYSVGEAITITFTDSAADTLIIDATVTDRDPKGIRVRFLDIPADRLQRLKALM